MTAESNKAGEIYLIVPSDEEDGVKHIVDSSVEDQSAISNTLAKIGFGSKRKQVTVNSAKVQQQVNNYITIVKNLAGEEQNKPTKGLRLEEIKLSLTLSAEGNIGIASTSAEAGIELVFKRG